MSDAVRVARTWGEMIKFSHSIFALPFAVLATFLAARPQRPAATDFILIVLCMVAARSAAMTFNRLVDAEIDARNPRTARRPLPAGHISAAAAWLFFLASSLAFLAACAGFWWLRSNPWPLLLGLPVLAWLCFYSYTKRFTALAHLVLGSGIAFAPVAAWIAVSPNTLGATAVWLLVAVATWIAGFDIIYACLDAEFDRSAGLFSIPARLGVGPALWIARGLHVLTALALLAVGRSAGLGAWYYAGAAAVMLLLIIENAIVHPRDLSRVNLAFFTVNGVIGLILGVLGVADILVRT